MSKDSGGGTAGSSAAVQNEALPALTRNPRSARAAANRADESFEDAGASGVASVPTRPGSASKAVEKPSAGALSSLLADSSSPVPALQEAAGIMAPSSSRLLHSVLAEGGEDAVGPGDEVLANVVQVLDGHGVFDEGAAAEGAAGVSEEGEKHVPVQVGVDYDQYILATRFCGRVHPLVELRCKKRGKTLKSHLWLRPDRGVSITVCPAQT
ncbi:hypothetical protein EON66_04020 [archaeon]|nr:MAG: hypothetical protein EON66_04020 [archaeon]